MATSVDNRFRRAIESEGEAAERARRRRREYDPRSATREAGRAQWEEIREEMSRDIDELRGEQVGMGRLDTGFATRDEDRLVENYQEELSRAMAQNALRESQLNLRNIEGMDASRNRYLDALTGQRDYELLKEQQQGGLFGSIGSLVGGGAGFLLGGPAGAYVGSQIGGGAGRTAAGIL